MHRNIFIFILSCTSSIFYINASENYEFFIEKIHEGQREQDRSFNQRVEALVHEKKIKKQTQKELEAAAAAQRSWWQGVSEEEQKKLEKRIAKEQHKRIHQARNNARAIVEKQDRDELLRQQKERAEFAKKVGTLVRGSLQKPGRFDAELDNIAYQELEAQKIRDRQAAQQALLAEWNEYKKNPQFEQKARTSLTRPGGWRNLWYNITPSEQAVQIKAEELAKNSFEKLQKERAATIRQEIAQKQAKFGQYAGGFIKKSLQKPAPFESDIENIAYHELEKQKKQNIKQEKQAELAEEEAYKKDIRFEQEARKALTRKVPFFSPKDWIYHGKLWGGEVPPTEEEVKTEAKHRAQESFPTFKKEKVEAAQRLQQEKRAAQLQEAEARARGITSAEQKAAQRFKSFVGKADTEKIKESLIEGYGEMNELRQRNIQADIETQEHQKQAELAEWNQFKANPHFKQEAQQVLSKPGRFWGTTKPTDAEIQAEADRRARASFTALKQQQILQPTQQAPSASTKKSWFPSLNLSRYKPMGGTGIR